MSLNSNLYHACQECKFQNVSDIIGQQALVNEEQRIANTVIPISMWRLIIKCCERVFFVIVLDKKINHCICPFISHILSYIHVTDRWIYDPKD